MSTKPWGWKVIKDNISKPEDELYRVGKTYRNYQGGDFRYRLKDDDGEIYFYILSDIDPDEGSENQLFAPLDWAMHFAGCASIEYKDKKTGEYIIL